MRAHDQPGNRQWDGCTCVVPPAAPDDVLTVRPVVMCGVCAARSVAVTRRVPSLGWEGAFLCILWLEKGNTAITPRAYSADPRVAAVAARTHAHLPA